MSPGKAQPSYDKQYVRDWLTSAESGWDKASDTPPPALSGGRRGAHAQPLRRGVREAHRPDVQLANARPAHGAPKGARRDLFQGASSVLLACFGCCGPPLGEPDLQHGVQGLLDAVRALRPR